MGLRDSITDALGSVVGGAAGILSEAMRKANGPMADEPSARGQGMVSQEQEGAVLPPTPSGEAPRGLLYDPFALIDQLGYRDRPSGITYATLREMAKRVPTYTAVLQTQLTQLGAFAQVQKDAREPGFGIVLRDDKAHPSKQDLIRMHELETFLLQTGSTWHPGRDDFSTFIKKVGQDSLVLDQMCFEVVRNRKGEPAEFYAMDSATIRMADVPPGAEAGFDPNQVKYVQIYDEVIITEYAAHELCFGVRNPRTDIRANGYGFSELEMLINVVTATLWSLEYNKRQFSQGTLANGILNFKGQVSDAKVDGFRRQWKMMIAGVNNSHRVPMTNVEELQWIDFAKTNRDMEYSAWIDFLIKITCGVCQFDPAEINFNYGHSGQSGSMFGGGQNIEAKNRQSKARWLRPLLHAMARWLNVNLIWPLDPSMELEFKGLDSKSEDQSVGLDQKKSQFMKTVNEIRAENDMDPLPNGTGDIILNSVWLQNKQAAEQQQQGQQGAPGQPEAPSQPPDEQQDTSLVDLERERQDQAASGPNPDSEFQAMFPEKSDKGKDDLRKSDRKAKVKVFEIDLP